MSVDYGGHHQLKPGDMVMLPDGRIVPIHYISSDGVVMIELSYNHQIFTHKNNVRCVINGYPVISDAAE